MPAITLKVIPLPQPLHVIEGEEEQHEMDESFISEQRDEWHDTVTKINMAMYTHSLCNLRGSSSNLEHGKSRLFLGLVRVVLFTNYIHFSATAKWNRTQARDRVQYRHLQLSGNFGGLELRCSSSMRKTLN